MRSFFQVKGRLPLSLVSAGTLLDFTARPTIASGSNKTPRQSARVLAALEDWDASRKRCFISIDPLHKAPASSRHVVDKLRLMQPQSGEVDHINVGAKTWRESTAIRQSEKVGSFARLPLDEMLDW
jgi:hypothetical protein